MIIAYSMVIVFMVAALISFFAPAYSFEVVAAFTPTTTYNATLFNVATGFTISNTVAFETIDLALSLFVSTIIGIIVSGGFILFYVFYNKKSSYKIKRMIASTAISTVLNVINILICVSLVLKMGELNLKIGLAPILYFVCSGSACLMLGGVVITIVHKFFEKNNDKRFEELKLVEQSILPYIEDPYQKMLADARVKYLLQMHTAPNISKQDLQTRKEQALKLMMENDNKCHCHHE